MGNEPKRADWVDVGWNGGGGLKRDQGRRLLYPFRHPGLEKEKEAVAVMIRFTIPGRPVPAVRMTQRGKFVRKYAGRYLAYKNQVGWAAKAAGVQPIPKGTEVEVKIKVYMRRTPGRQPDLDNIQKGILDGLNGFGYEDDRQITRLTIEKNTVQTEDEERAEITIQEAEKGCKDAS